MLVTPMKRYALAILVAAVGLAIAATATAETGTPTTAHAAKKLRYGESMIARSWTRLGGTSVGTGV